MNTYIHSYLSTCPQGCPVLFTRAYSNNGPTTRKQPFRFILKYRTEKEREEKKCNFKAFCVTPKVGIPL